MPDTIIPFTPDENSAPPFRAQFSDAAGRLYTISTWWNMAGQRWYLKVEDSAENTLLFRPLIGSPRNYDINLIGSISSARLIFREDDQAFEVTQ